MAKKASACTPSMPIRGDKLGDSPGGSRPLNGGRRAGAPPAVIGGATGVKCPVYRQLRPYGGLESYLELSDRVTGIYWSHRANGQWTEPERIFLSYYDQPSLEGAPTVHPDTLWFVSARAGNYKDLDLWTAQLIDGRWTARAYAGQLLNQAYEIGETHLSADGREMYFDSRREGGRGEKDIWVTRMVDGEWQEPENLPSINTSQMEGWPYLSEDGTELWFTRAGFGAPDI